MSAIKGVPHPFPYQGSKRQLASYILALIPNSVNNFYEPFAGSAAITIASAYKNKATHFVINDLHTAIIKLWNEIVHRPAKLCEQYTQLWNEQIGRDREYYDEIRDLFNKTQKPHYLLYLLARCVKAAIRYNSNGEFNNSPDKRRLGMKPETMRKNILLVSEILNGRVTITNQDYKVILDKTSEGDLVYMDPPYQGVCNVRDHRYCDGVDFMEFCEQLDKLNRKQVDFIVSYDGRTGDKTYGEELPTSLSLQKYEIQVGKSTQATLLGRNEYTYESLYLSSSIVDKLEEIPVPTQISQNQYPLFCGINS